MYRPHSLRTKKIEKDKQFVSLVPLEELDFRLGAKRVFANKTLFKEARPGQLRNYNKLFKDRDVIDTVIEAIRIIEKYTVQNDG